MQAACFAGMSASELAASQSPLGDDNRLSATAVSRGPCGLRNGLDTTFTYALVNVTSQLALTNSVGYGLNASAVLQPLDKGPNQSWAFVPFSNGSTRLVNFGMVLGLKGAQSGPSALWTDGGNPDHVWVVNVVDPDACTVTVTNVLAQEWLGINHPDNLRGAQVGSGAFADDSFDHIWQLVALRTAWPDPMELSTEAEVTNPSLVKVGSTYLLYSDGVGINVQSTQDRSRFRQAGQAFAAMPAWVSARFGAAAVTVQPSVSLRNGQVVLLYSAYTTDPRVAEVGMAISATGEPNSFGQARGLLASGTASATYPSLFTAPDGSTWLESGLSEGGLSEDGLDTSSWLLKSDPSNPCNLLYRYHGTRLGSSSGGVFQHGAYTFRFATYFETADTQHVVVTRAGNYYDTYKDRSDISEFQGGGTIVLSTHGRVVSPGHPSVFSDTDGDFLVYDYHDAVDGKQHLGMNRISWAGDWPTLVP